MEMSNPEIRSPEHWNVEELNGASALAILNGSKAHDDHHLLHHAEECSETDSTEYDKKYAYGAGTTKRKELHGTTIVRASSGNWAEKPCDVTLNAYKINFHCNQINTKYSSFALLVESTIDDDIASAEIDLYLIPNKVVKASLCQCGQVQLTLDQVKKSKLFHELFFNGLFGRLFVISKSSDFKREFLLKDGKENSWSSSNTYLLLPLEHSSNASHKALSINWNGIYACASLVEFLRNIYSTNGEYCYRSSLTSIPTSCEAKSDGSGVIYMANKAIYGKCLKDMVVLAIHTGRIYNVIDVKFDMSANSPFDGNVDGKKQIFISFTDYYSQRYNIVLRHPGQPMLLVKQSHNPHNLLSQCTRYQDGSIDLNLTTERAQRHVHIPPELLVQIDVSTDVLKSFYLLPSLMYRLESMMLACQLREEIGYSQNTRVPYSLILEAISTIRCCENFSSERLELLGDSVLKYAMSCHLFLKHPTGNEGQLSESRSRAVRNSTLHKLGVTRGLQGYIRDSAFDPRRWAAPGLVSLHPVPCTCGIHASEVPLRRAYLTGVASTMVGKACDKGHRWMCSKTIADCVEALIGAYYVGAGLDAVHSLMRWLGMDIAYDPILIKEAKMTASLWSYQSTINDIQMLESKLDYKFSVKGLLLEAITHSPRPKFGVDYRYQRLEFLGDSVLDLLITSHLFQTHPDIDPGDLTDLRSASVSNEKFGHVTVRHNLHHHLQHAPIGISKDITKYVQSFLELCGEKDSLLSLQLPKRPKVLGDLMESIVGAILVDTAFDLDKVWRVIKPLISPIVTPDKLELPPLRKLIELCSHLGYPINTQCMCKEERYLAELSVQLEDDLLVRCGCDGNRKAAKAQAAFLLLKDLEKKGMSHAQYLDRKMHQKDKCNSESLCSIPNVNISAPPKDNAIAPQDVTNHLQAPAPSPSSLFAEKFFPLDDHLNKKSKATMNIPVMSVSSDKGGPRKALFELCRISKWPMPKFEEMEHKSRAPIELDGVEGPHFNSFTSTITLHIPNETAITFVGEPRGDKKSSRDSAALAMLRELKNQGKCIIRVE